MLSREEIAALRERERSKRFVAFGTVLFFCGVVWVFFALRATRYRETTCTVFRLPDGSCSVQHWEKGEEYELLSHSDCDKPSWPGPAPVGSELGCYYYLRAPNDIFFDKHEPLWLFAIPLALLGLGLGLRLAGTWKRRRASRPADEASPDPYRAPGVPERDPEPPLEVPLMSRAWLPFGMGGMLFGIGIVLVVMGLVGGWIASGPELPGALGFFAFASAWTMFGAFGQFCRTGLVFDMDAGTLLHWWGFRARWFDSTFALSDLGSVTYEERSDMRGYTSYMVVLTFADGRRWKPDFPSADAARAVIQRINDYLSGDDTPEASQPPPRARAHRRKRRKRRHTPNPSG